MDSQMNTISRLDSYLFSLISIPSTSKPSLKRTITPPPHPPSSSSSSVSSNTNPSPRLSNLPPTPRPKRRYKSSSSSISSHSIEGRNRRRKTPTTYSSIKVPPPTTPIIFRIALVLWSILLSFWRSLVGETRSGRSRTRRRLHRDKSKLNGVTTSSSSSGSTGGVGVLRELGESLMVSAGITSLPEQSKDIDQDQEPEGSSSEVEPELEVLGEGENETEQEEEDNEWIDPLVTRASKNQSSLDKPPPTENEFGIAIRDDQFRNPANFSFRLKSASTTTTQTVESPSIDTKPGLKSKKSYTNFIKQPSPTSILSNPILSTPKKVIDNKITNDIEDDKEVKVKQEKEDEEKITPTRKSGILANPISTSILDPSVPAPITKNDSMIFRKPNSNSSFGTPNTQTLSNSINKIPKSIITTPFHLQKTLILDLDETLIHSTSRPLLNSSSSGGGGILGLSLVGLRKNKSRGTSSREGHAVEVVLNGRSTMYHVYKRPYVDHFLKKVASWYTLVIFTASMPEYADPVIEWLDAGRNLFAKRLYRESCHLQPNGSYIKDLALVEKDLSRVCFMDNSPVSYNWNKANALPIEGWTSDPNDEALLQSIPVLDSLRFVNDVRRVLGIRGFT